MRWPEAGGVRAGALLALLLAPAVAQAQWKTESAEVVFEGKGPAGFSLRGTTGTLSLSEDGETLRFSVPLATLKTGIGLRDRHMREKYLQTDQFPDAVLEVPWSVHSLPPQAGPTEGTARGALTLHGVRKEVELTYQVRREGERWQVSARLPLKITDFDIHVPSYLGITVKPDVLVRVQLSARGRPPADLAEKVTAK